MEPTTAIEILRESPLTPLSELGPYRKRDYLALPDRPRCELIYGRLYEMTSPKLLHQLLQGLLWQHFHAIVLRTGGYVFTAPMDVTLADHSVVQPDVMYVSPSRRGVLQERIEGAPDLLVEIVSPSTVRRDRGEKLKLYAESGVREFWLADLDVRHIDFLVNRGGRFEVVQPVDDRYRSPELPEIEIDLAGLWRDFDRELSGRPA